MFRFKIFVNGFCVFLRDSIVSWKTKKQSTVSRLSTKVEYHALASTVNELIWIHQLFLDFHITPRTPAVIFCDNRATVHVATNPIFHERTKHIEIDCHFIREKINYGFIKLFPIQTNHQFTDIFPKPLSTSVLFPLLPMMAVINLYNPS